MEKEILPYYLWRVKHPVLKIGCCGFPVSKTKYAEQFAVGEVQQTFYQPPQLSTLERWREMAPADFEFTVKAWQLITHAASSPTYRRLKIKMKQSELDQCGSFRLTPPVLEAWEITRRCAKALRARYVLFQCPASFSCSAENVARMRRFFSSIKRRGLKLLWEPRGKWPGELVHSLCKELDLIHAVDPFVSESVTPKFLYYRLHGINGYRHVYTDAELQKLKQLTARAPIAYVFFNNSKMWEDAVRFGKL